MIYFNHFSVLFLVVRQPLVPLSHRLCFRVRLKFFRLGDLAFGLNRLLGVSSTPRCFSVLQSTALMSCLFPLHLSLDVGDGDDFVKFQDRAV